MTRLAMIRSLTLASLISGGLLVGTAAPALAAAPQPSILLAPADDDSDDSDDSDDDDDRGSAPRGGVETGRGGVVPADDSDDDDDDRGSAPRGGVETGLGSTAPADDDDDDRGPAPRGGVETGMGGTAGDALLPIALGGAAVVAGGATFLAARGLRGRSET